MAHIPRSTAHAALAAEAATGAASAVGAALERAVARATPTLLDVLGRYPTYPRGRNKVAQIVGDLDRTLREQ